MCTHSKWANEQTLKTELHVPFYLSVHAFVYSNPFYRTYKYTMTQINFLPLPGFEPGSLGTVSRWPIQYAMVPHQALAKNFITSTTNASTMTEDSYRSPV